MPSHRTEVLGVAWKLSRRLRLNEARDALVLTSSSGLMAVSFWTLRGDFDPAWWLPNLFLLLYPFRYFSFFVRDSRS